MEVARFLPGLSRNNVLRRAHIGAWAEGFFCLIIADASLKMRRFASGTGRL
jgi:hypothetical protein